MAERDNNNDTSERERLRYLRGDSPLRGYWEDELAQRKIKRNLYIIGAATAGSTICCITAILLSSK
jgi:hypothetical protein